MAAGGTPSNIDLGPGRLYYAPLGTAEPANCSSALPSAWIPVGYTEDGTSFTVNITSDSIEVAEEIDPVLFVQSKRTTQFQVNMAESTKKRLALALGAGAGQTDDSTPFEWPDASTVVSGVMFVWDYMDTPDATNKRWLVRQATPSGTVAIARKKSPAKTLIGVTFDCAKPSSTTKSIKVFPSSTGLI